jgi:hypothetical protein
VADAGARVEQALSIHDRLEWRFLSLRCSWLVCTGLPDVAEKRLLAHTANVMVSYEKQIYEHGSFPWDDLVHYASFNPGRQEFLGNCPFYENSGASYPPQIPHLRPSWGAHGHPRLVLPQLSHVVLWRTPVVVFSQCCPFAGGVNSAAVRWLAWSCLRQSQGATGKGAAHNPLRSRLASISASESDSSSEYIL